MSSGCLNCKGALYGCPWEDEDISDCDDKAVIERIANLAYKTGKKESATFLKQWKDDVVESLAKYDANSVEEVYQYGINRGVDLLFKAICQNDLISDENKLIMARLLADEIRGQKNG